MQQIVQYNDQPSSMSRFKSVLRAIRAADITSAEADVLWDQAHCALDLPTSPLQSQRLAQIEHTLFSLTRQAVSR